MTDDVNDFFRFLCPRVRLRTTRENPSKITHSHSIVLGGLLEMS